MSHVKLFLYIEALLCIVYGLKVNMQGSLSLGRDVVETLSHYLEQNFRSGRRSLNPPPIEDPITLTVRNMLICKDLFCQDELQHFINEYIIILAKAVSSILTNADAEFDNQTYNEQLLQSLKEIRKILEHINLKIETGNEAYYWTHLIKRISAKFQKDGEDLSDSNEVTELNNTTANLRQKMVIATAFIERKYLIKLCSEYKICSESQECTTALNKILIHFKTLPEDRIRLFVKYFYEALFDTEFYTHLREGTANDFQVILNDMSYANDTPTKDIMLSVLKTVEARIETVQMNKGVAVEHEILIAHTILSDMDHMFHNRTNVFTMFLNQYYDWLASDVHLQKHIRGVLADIENQIGKAEEDLVDKLIDEVKVFLEMAVSVKEL